MLDEPPSSASLLVDTIQEPALDVMAVIAQEARTLAREPVDHRSRSVMQEAAGDLGDRPLDVFLRAVAAHPNGTPSDTAVSAAINAAPKLRCSAC